MVNTLISLYVERSWISQRQTRKITCRRVRTTTTSCVM